MCRALLGRNAEQQYLHTDLLILTRGRQVFSSSWKAANTNVIQRCTKTFTVCKHVWISKLWVLSCEKLLLSQATYLFNCGGNRVPKIVLSARAPLKIDMSSGRLFFFRLQAGVSGHHPASRSCVLRHRMPEVTEWERGPRAVFLLCGEK